MSRTRHKRLLHGCVCVSWISLFEVGRQLVHGDLKGLLKRPEANHRRRCSAQRPSGRVNESNRSSKGEVERGE